MISRNFYSAVGGNIRDLVVPISSCLSAIALAQASQAHSIAPILQLGQSASVQLFFGQMERNGPSVIAGNVGTIRALSYLHAHLFSAEIYQGFPHVTVQPGPYIFPDGMGKRLELLIGWHKDLQAEIFHFLAVFLIFL
jgi:hypothetical protein